MSSPKFQQFIEAAKTAVRNRALIYELTGLTGIQLISKWFKDYELYVYRGGNKSRDEFMDWRQKQLFRIMEETLRAGNHPAPSN